MRLFLPFFLLTLISTAFAEVSRENVDEMIKQMVKEEVISAAEAEKARARLHSMNPKEWKELNQSANKVASRSPASVPEKETSDLHRAQFNQIQDDIKKIIPERRD